jgi:hypothetical protein
MASIRHDDEEEQILLRCIMASVRHEDDEPLTPISPCYCQRRSATSMLLSLDLLPRWARKQAPPDDCALLSAFRALPACSLTEESKTSRQRDRWSVGYSTGPAVQGRWERSTRRALETPQVARALGQPQAADLE